MTATTGTISKEREVVASLGDLGTPKSDQTAKTALGSKAYGSIVITLENAILPPEKLKPTPSELDGLDPDDEFDLRNVACELIQTAGLLLKLPQTAMATGQVLFQRFYFVKSFVRQSMETSAMACIYLASKIEEAPRRIRDVINVFHHIKQVRANKIIQPMVLDGSYIRLKADVTLAERRVLKELGFCVHVKHPHKLIVMYLRCLSLESNTQLIQLAWNYMNDSLRTYVFVKFSPETIACACIYLSARKVKIPLPKNPPWFVVFDSNEADIREVCETLLMLYERPKVNIEKLEKTIGTLSKAYQENRNRAKLPLSAQASPANLALNVPSPIVVTSRPATPKVEVVQPVVKAKEPTEQVSTKKRYDDDRHYDDSRNGDRNRRRDRDRSRSRSRTRSPSRKKSRRSPSPITYHNSPPRHKHKKRKKSRYSYSRSRSRSPSRDRDRYRERDRRDKKKSHRRDRTRSPSPRRHYSSSKKSYRDRDRDRDRY